MTVMQLCSYVQPFSPTASLSVWYAAVAGHFALMIAFSLRFLRRFRLADVYPTYFIAFVGIVVASVTSAAFDRQALGFGIFWFGFIAYLILLAVVTARYVKLPVADSAKPCSASTPRP